MSDAVIESGGVIAAGEGSRLRERGSKALVEVGGEALLGHAIRRLLSAGVKRVVVIVREEDRALEPWIRSRFPDVDVDVVVKTTASSAESLCEVVNRLDVPRVLVSTVDAVLPDDAFLAFARAAAARPPDALGLGVTPWVDDEKPLWADWDDTGRVTALGGPSGRGATAGLYVVPRDLPSLVGEGAGRPLRSLLGTWVGLGRPTWAEVLEKVVDVDRPIDVAEAESLWRDGGPAGRDDRDAGASS